MTEHEKKMLHQFTDNVIKYLNENYVWPSEKFESSFCAVVKESCTDVISQMEEDDSEEHDTDKHDAEIRSDERQKFAKWLSDCGYLGKQDSDGFGISFHEPLVANEVLAEYEKERSYEKLS